MSVKGTRLIQLADDGLAPDPNHVVLAGDASADVHAGSFLTGLDARDGGRSFFVQVVEPQSNVNRDALGRFDPVSLNRMGELLAGRAVREALVRDGHLYVARVCGMTQGEGLTAATLRPNIGTCYCLASADEVRRFVGLPQEPGVRRVGRLAYADIPLNVRDRLLSYHVLVAGATGCGKTHACAGLVKAASDLGRCVIVLDAKPDYQCLDEPNPDAAMPARVDDARFFSLDGTNAVRGPGAEDFLSVPASALDPRALAYAVFHAAKDEDHLDNLIWLLEQYHEANEGRRWTWADFLGWAGGALRSKDRDEVKGKAVWGPHPPAPATLDAIGRRLTRQRPPAWVDRAAPGGAGVMGTFARGRDFDLAALAQPGRVLVVRVPPSQAGSREYALLVTYLTRQALSLRPANPTPLLFLIDEAHDLFRGSRKFVAEVTDALDAAIRKGRSQRIGFVLAVQNADGVPDDILNNLHSHFLGRHQNTGGVAKACGAVFDEPLLSLLPTLGAGEFLVRLHEARAAVQCKIDLAPFKIYEVMA
jgi:Helicase HerA, central domain